MGDSLRRLALTLGSCIVGAGAAVATWEIEVPGCRAPAEFEAELRPINAESSRCRYSERCWREQMAARRALRDRYPTLIQAHAQLLKPLDRLRVDLEPEYRRTLRAEYEAEARLHPGDSAFRYFLALLEADPPQRREVLAALADEAPPFPWAARDLIRLTASDDPPTDEGRRAAWNAAFESRCPGAVGERLELLRYVDDSAFSRLRLAGLRDRLSADFQTQWRVLPDLWAAEFSAFPPEKHAELRRRVEADLEEVRRLERPDDESWLRTLRIGYETTGNEEGSAWVRREISRRAPCAGEARDLWARSVEAAAPKLERGDPQSRLAWSRHRERTTRERLEVCPEDSVALFHRALALRVLPEAGDEQFLAAADRLLANDDPGVATTPSIPGWFAGAYLDRGLRIDHVPTLLLRDAQQAALDHASALRFATTDDLRRETELTRAFRETWREGLRARWQVARGELDAAARSIASVRSRCDELQRSGCELARLQVPRAVALRAEADLQVQQGNFAEALARYAELLGYDIGEPLLHARAAVVWREAGHETKGFERWISEVESRQAVEKPLWEVVHRAFPPGEIVDFQGQPWSPSGEGGKVVLVNLWTTWCGPCRAELPELHRLAATIATDPGFAVRVISLDGNRGVVVPFLAENGYDFPAAFGPASWLGDAVSGVPVTWIVDPAGQIVRERVGFAAAPDWVEETLEEMRRLAAGGAVGSAPAAKPPRR